MASTGRDLLRHPLSMLGAALATITGSLVTALFLASLAGYEGNPYLGMVTYVVLPSLLVVGLLLIPAGAVLQRRRLLRLAASGSTEPPLPVIDFNSHRTRRFALVFLALTTVNLLLIGAASYKGLEVMDSTEFCGSCHSVMDPEATAHARSPHARVRCVECHIGPGASWFVKSKLAGSWQLVSVMLELYPKPIPTPVQALRPARDTCEQCHWPAKFVGDRFKVITRHAEDAASTPLKTVLLVHVGGTRGATTHGIHWHVDKGVTLRYQADERREKIGAIELTDADGTQRRWELPGAAPAAGAPWRTMDCIDCHNRPTHVYQTAEDEVDAALQAGRLDARLPFLRREAIALLKVDYPSREAAAAGLRAGLGRLYGTQPAQPAQPDQAAQPAQPAKAAQPKQPAQAAQPKQPAQPDPGPPRAPMIEAAAVELAAIWGRNVWPQMKIGWGTYPTLLGHQQAPGCFRCHDGEHATREGKVISNDCDLCHSILAQEEKDPAILRQLSP